MKTPLKILLAGGLLFLVFGYIQFFRAVQDNRTREEAEGKAREKHQFEEGFFAGARAVTRVMIEDTNTGKWTLELTNLFKALRDIENENGRRGEGQPEATNR